MNNIITLTTDWGTSDNYLAIFKAHLLREDAALQTVDITHQLPPNHIREAAFLLKTAYHYFPKNSVHIVDVNWTHPHNERAYKTALQNETAAAGEFPFFDYLAFQYKEHYFLCENNGIISFLFDKFKIDEVVKLPVDERYADFQTFKAIPYYVKAAADLAKGIPLREIGEKYDVNRIETIPNTPPIVTESEENDIISFNALHVDNYGNIITNLEKKQFNTVADGRTRFEFYHTSLGMMKKQKITTSYNDVAKSSVLFLFGHSGHLEILMKHVPFSKFLLDHNASHNMQDWKFTILFKKKEGE
jgi:S-adenosylmethionine hydrolase